MHKKSFAKRILAFLLAVVLVTSLIPVSFLSTAIFAKAESTQTPTVKPFYMVNWSSGFESGSISNIYWMPQFTLKGDYQEGMTEIAVLLSANGKSTSDINRAAEILREEFEKRPAGTRYITLNVVPKLFKQSVEDAIDFSIAIELVRDWLNKFLTAYEALDGKLDGIAMDLEYRNCDSYGLQTEFCVARTTTDADGNTVTTGPVNPRILQDIVQNQVYREKIRPQLEKLVEENLFSFYESGKCRFYFEDYSDFTENIVTIDPNTGLPNNEDHMDAALGNYNELGNGVTQYPVYVSELTTINYLSAAGGKENCANIWDAIMQRHLADCINEAVYNPLKTYYPDANLGDYSSADTYTWNQGFSSNGKSTGTGVKTGNTSNSVYYGSPISDSFYDNTKSTVVERQDYVKPAGQTAAVYDYENAYAVALREINNHKRILASVADNGESLTNVWVADFNHPDSTHSWGDTAYYSELIYHLGLTNPEPFLGYIYKANIEAREISRDYTDPDLYNYEYALNVANDLLAELTRVAGASDRKPIETPVDWDSGFVYSGMYAGGRNIWRLTPDTDKVSKESFKVSGDNEAPAFTVNGVTITFPQGRILKDASVTRVGTCGYWIETPEDVTPVITRPDDYFANYPSFGDTFDSYTVGDFTTIHANTPGTVGNPADAYWTASGIAQIVNNNSGKAMALTGTITLTNDKVPPLITAGDHYAKQQAWEVTVTMPANLSGTIKLLNYSKSDNGFKIENGKVTCGSTATDVTLTGGETYTFKRVVDFANNTSSYYINNAIAAENVTNASVELPVENIYMSTSNVSGTVTIDNYKLYPVGVTATLDLYETIDLVGELADYQGLVRKIADTSAERTEKTGYRVSWTNASNDYKVAILKGNGEEIERAVMAPGASGYFAGLVQASNENPVTFALEQASMDEPTLPDDDFSWTPYHEYMGITCYVGEDGYTSLEEAMKNAKNRQTVAMLTDAEIDSTIVVDRSVKLLSNCYTINLGDNFNGEYVFEVTVGGLTLKDSQFTCENGILVSGGALNVINSDLNATNDAILVLQDTIKTPISVTVSGGTLTGARAFYLDALTGMRPHDVSMTTKGTAVTGTVDIIVSATDFFVIQQNGSDYTLHEHDHTIDIPTIAPTCTQNGWTNKITIECNSCDEGKHKVLYQEEIPALGHKLKNICGNKVCVNCGYHEATGDAPAHNYVTKTTEPTCTTEGSTIVSCTVCDHEYISNTVPAKGHTFSEAPVRDESTVIAATCTTDGSYDESGFCTVCDKEVTQHVIVPATGHTKGAEEVRNEVAATCTIPGSYDIVTCCTACGVVSSRKTVVVTANHTYADGVCTGCGQAEDGTASLTITTGASSSAISAWSPKLIANMKPLYATTTADGYIDETGETAFDGWKLKVEWPTNGTPTLTLRNATLTNDTRGNNATIAIGGTTAFVIELQGTNTINGAPTNETTTTKTASLNPGINAANTADLIIRGNNRKTDSLVINNKGGHCIYGRDGALTIARATVEMDLVNTGTNTQHGIVMMAQTSPYYEKTNVNVLNAKLDIHCGTYQKNRAIIFVLKTPDTTQAENNGDVVFRNSEVKLVREGPTSGGQTRVEIVSGYDIDNTVTIDRCDIECSANDSRTFRTVPDITNCSVIDFKNSSNATVNYNNLEVGTAITTKAKTINTTHACQYGDTVVETVTEGCFTSKETVQYCTICGDRNVVATEDLGLINAHTPGSKVLHESNSTSYTYQYTCAVCGTEWTEDEAFTTGNFYYLAPSEDTAPAGIWTGTSTVPKIKKVKPGDIYYFVTQESDDGYEGYTYVIELTDDIAIANGDWNIKLEYPVGGTPVLTMNGATIKNGSGLWWGVGSTNLDAPLKIVLKGDNLIEQTEYTTGGSALAFKNKSDVTITSVDDGKLTIYSNGTGAAIRSKNGNVIFDHANIEVTKTSTTTTVAPGAIQISKGDLTINGGRFVLKGSRTDGKKEVTAGISVSNNITIQNGADVTLSCALSGNTAYVLDAAGVTLSESSLRIGATTKGKAISRDATLVVDYTHGFESYFESSTNLTTLVDGSLNFPEHNAEKKLLTEEDLHDRLYIVNESYPYLYIAPTKPLVEMGLTRIGLESNLVIEFALDASKVAKGAYAIIERTRDGVAEPIDTAKVMLNPYTMENDGFTSYYVIPYAGIAAKEIRDKITVTVYDANGNVVTLPKTDSVYDYALRMLRGENPCDTEEEFAELKTLLVDLINYSAMAQVEFNHYADNPVNKALTDDEFALGSEDIVVDEPTNESYKATADGEGYMATAFVLKSNIAMMMGLNTTKAQLGEDSYAIVTIAGEDTMWLANSVPVAGTPLATYTFNGLDAADGNAAVTWKFYTKDGELKLTVTDSLANYVNRNISKHARMENLLKYCNAAYEYFY